MKKEDSGLSPDDNSDKIKAMEQMADLSWLQVYWRPILILAIILIVGLDAYRPA